MKILIIKPYGRTGNNIIQHMLAIYLKASVPDLRICCTDPTFLKDFEITFDPLPQTTNNGEVSVSIKDNRVNFDQLIKKIKQTPSIRVFIDYCTFDATRYLTVIDQLRLLYGGHSHVEGYNSQYIVIHVRLGDILTGTSIHQNMPIIPISFYQWIISQTHLLPVFIGELGDDVVSKKLRQVFPQAIFPPKRELIDDFECMRKSSHLLVAVSTFSFLAGFLASDQTQVYVSLYGLYNHRDRPDCHFFINHPRYHYYRFPSIKWNASPQQLSEVISDRSVEYSQLVN
jgi:hypothetical protein